MGKRLNHNPLSNCALDHRPLSDKSRDDYYQVQAEIIKRNAVKDYGPLEEVNPPELQFDYVSTEVDYACSDVEIQKIAETLARIRIEDKNNVYT